MLALYFIAFLHSVLLGDYPINIKEFTPISINANSVSVGFFVFFGEWEIESARGSLCHII